MGQVGIVKLSFGGAGLGQDAERENDGAHNGGCSFDHAGIPLDRGQHLETPFGPPLSDNAPHQRLQGAPTVEGNAPKKLSDGCAERGFGARPACDGSFFDGGHEPVGRAMRLGAYIDQSGQGLDRLAFVSTSQKPNRTFVANHAWRLDLPDDMLGNHVDEELFPLGRIIHLGADHGEQLICGFARHFSVRENLALQPHDILCGHAAAQDHRTDDRTAPVDCERHHTHLHSLQSANLVDGSGCAETLRLNIFPQVNPAGA
jgi:hypothetical protein